MSLIRFGQLQPIILNEAGELVDGLHRLLGAQANGQTDIWYDVREVDEVLHREIELETNIRRTDMSPAERVRAIAEIHKLKMSHDPNWGQTQTMIAIKSSRAADVSDAIKLDQMMTLFPELAEAKSIRQMKSWAEAKANNITRVIEVKDNVIDYRSIEPKIILGDSVEVIRDIPSESFHAIITDPPFGINYDDRKSNTEGAITSYEDDKESYERLLSMGPDLYRVIKPNGWMVWFLGISWYERCKQSFREAGFIVDEIPIIWDRSAGRCHTNRPDRYFTRGYDIALHCIKGNPQLIQRGKPNVIPVPPVSVDEREALVERPVALYAELIRRLTVPGETVADFFVGSGSCLAAAVSLNRDYFGVERDPERRAIAIKKIRAHTPAEAA